MLIRNFARFALISLALSQGALAEGTSVGFGGLKGDPKAQVEMNSDTLTVNQADGSAIFSGNVVVIQGAMKLSADEVRVQYGADKNTIDKLFANGSVLLVNATDAAQADQAVYTIAAGEIEMTGNVLLTQGQAAMSAQKLVIDLKTGKGRMEGRVKTTFVPGKK
jgi:lipopolysaccharide export system protein LptA